MKICKKCHKSRRNSSFTKTLASKDGLYSYCKDCKKKYDKDLYFRKPEMFVKRRKERITSWRNYFPTELTCPLCGAVIKFSSGKKENSIAFDHRNGGSEIIKGSPMKWIEGHPYNPENRKIWESCEFGMLCFRCNKCIPTVNRSLWIRNLIKYHKKFKEEMEVINTSINMN